jgi:proton-translocating NADH-quinone oxidoreductase chain N
MVIDFLSYSLIPLFSALAIPFIARKNTRLVEIITNITLIAGFINVSYILLSYLIKDDPNIITIDIFSLLMIFIIYLVGLAITFFSSNYGIENETNPISYYSLILIGVSAMSSIVITQDIFSLYVFVEALSIVSFALITSNNSEKSIEASIKYFFLTFPASVLIIFGISILLLNNPNLDFLTIKDTSSKMLSIIGLSIIIVGFLIKSGIVPFHFWTPDVYQGSYSPISAFLAGIITKTGGIYAIVKIASLITNSSLNYYLSKILLVSGLLSVIIGAFLAMVQKDFKRILAYSSISQMGYIILAAATFTPLGIIAALFHIINHATFKTVLFLNSACVEKQTQTTNIDELKGLEHKMPVTSWTSIIAMMATAGIPPLSGFWSKLLVIVALWKSGNTFYAVTALIASILTLAYFVNLQKKVFFGKLPEKFDTLKETKAQLLIPVVVISAIIIFSGLFFNRIYSYLLKII